MANYTNIVLTRIMDNTLGHTDSILLLYIYLINTLIFCNITKYSLILVIK